MEEEALEQESGDLGCGLGSLLMGGNWGSHVMDS